MLIANVTFTQKTQKRCCRKLISIAAMMLRMVRIESHVAYVAYVSHVACVSHVALLPIAACVPLCHLTQT